MSESVFEKLIGHHIKNADMVFGDIAGKLYLQIFCTSSSNEELIEAFGPSIEFTDEVKDEGCLVFKYEDLTVEVYISMTE